MARISRESALVLCTSLFLGLPLAAHASLVDRGGGLIYDTDLNLTWLSNANLAQASAYDDGTNTTDGRMSWASATNWAASLNIGGVSGWRLPATLEPDPACTNLDGSPSGDNRGFTCTGSEMGHLFYGELGGTVNHTIFDSLDPDLALFSNIQGQYWSGTTEAGFPDYAWDFVFTAGNQSDAFKTTNFMHGWAVHDGDVAVVPAPGAAWLLGTGLLGLMERARRRKLRARD
jgi:Protein of unknown function (DUF1566)